MPLLSICIATRNRPSDLIQCLESLLLLKDYPYEVIVIDDASDVVIQTEIQNLVNQSVIKRTKFIRQSTNKGLVATRNELALQARSQYIMSLDDDACLLDADSIHKAVQVLENDSCIGAVALAQTNKTGYMLPSFMQPAPVAYDCYSQSFRGYGHILRRDLFIKLGGYRGEFIYGHEEVEYCKRLLNIGFNVVYLTKAKVIHNHSPIGRSELVRLRNGCRNACFDALYNEPLLMCIFSIPYRIIGYIRWRKVPCEHYGLFDEGGIRWQLNELYNNFYPIWQKRKPLKWSTYVKWRKIRNNWPVYNIN
ncbi:MAG: glycosyltransferase family 2 protein [Sphaerospermopsis sp. SIO1G2]|nr:glycosyltransferase family 2 protein [Sphaerospermopsis sp. SIO1G2]